MSLPPLAERAVLITGCSSGIGHACAHGLHKRGYRVFASARDPQDVKRLEAEGLEAVRLDMRDSASIHLALEQVLAATGNKLFGLFNNAGFGQPGALEDVSRDVLRTQFETNVFGVQELTCAVLPIMREQGYGRIIQNSSVLGFVSMAYRGAYNASKYALEGLSDTLRLELQDTPIRISLIEPGPIVSQFRHNAYQQFKRHINQENSYHREKYKRLVKRFETQEQVDGFTLGPEAVLKPLIHALESKRPRVRYRVTIPTKAMAILKRLLPDRALDALLGASAKRESQ